MYAYNDQIQAYEEDCVNLPHPVKEKLRGNRDANRNRLKRNRPERIRLHDGHFVPQGSMAIQTAIQEKENAYDIDDGVWFHAEDLAKKDGSKLTPRETQQLVCDALQDDKFAKKPEIHENCVRVFYKEGHHVDVPTYRLFDEGADAERQELAGKGGWTASDPTEINRWFEGRVQFLNKQRNDAGAQLRRMIRLAKRFARSRGDKWDMPNGLKLTMLVEECIPPYFSRDDECFYWLTKNLRDRLQLNLEVENRAQTKIPRDKITKAIADPNMIELRKRATEAVDKLLVLHHPECTKEQAREAWEWIFKSDGFFDAFDKDEKKARALFEKAALIHAGLAATNSSGVVGLSGVPNLPHKFYGDASEEQG